MAVSADLKLSIYNGALRHLGSRNLASLSENREPRRVLDEVWGPSDSAVKYALERGEWNFAIRTAMVQYNPSVEPDFGFMRAFDKPDDFARLAGLSIDGRFSMPMTNDQYVDEATFWFADYDTLYVRYVSTHDNYGLNGAGWSQTFIEYLKLYLAHESCVLFF